MIPPPIPSPRAWLLPLVLGFSLGCASCNPAEPELGASDLPKIVSTNTILADLTEQVGGDAINHQGLLEAGVDPHVYEPVPADSIALEQAALIFYNGYNLEPALERLIQAAGSQARQVAIAEQVEPLELKQEGEQVPDPHVWGDVQNVMVMVAAIRDELSELQPEQAATFAANASALINALEQLDAWIRAQIATIPASQRYLITTHDAFQYYAAAYGLTVPGTLIGISTEEQPSAQTVSQLVEEIVRARVSAIFAETTLNPTLIRTVAAEAGVELAPQRLYSDSLGAPGQGGDTYIRMMVANTRAIVAALGGEDRAFPGLDN